MQPTTRRWARVAVVGASATGKTQLGTTLAGRLHVPLVSLDDLRWQGGRTATDDEFGGRLADRVAGDGWILEGAETSAPVRTAWQRAELLVWLDHSPASVAVRMVRGTSWRRRVRAGQRLRYAAYVVRKARRSARQTRQLRRDVPGELAALRSAGADVVRLRSARATQAWLRSLC